jgi:hypothetical protein
VELQAPKSHPLRTRLCHTRTLINPYLGPVPPLLHYYTSPQPRSIRPMCSTSTSIMTKYLPPSLPTSLTHQCSSTMQPTQKHDKRWLAAFFVPVFVIAVAFLYVLHFGIPSCCTKRKQRDGWSDAEGANETGGWCFCDHSYGMRGK